MSRLDRLTDAELSLTQPFFMAYHVDPLKHLIVVVHPGSGSAAKRWPVENFVTLARKGFYDGLTFHRVEPGFVVQGGDPQGNGMGGPGYKIKAEFNKQKHVRGAVAMARSNDPDSAGSQF